MSAMALHHPGISIVATASAQLLDPESAPRRIPGVYADPGAWLVAEAVDAAIRSSDTDVLACATNVGVIGISEYATRHTLRLVAAGVPRDRVSPMRFAAASPGSLVGVTCTAFGFQGPTLMLSMSCAAAELATAAVAADWLGGNPPMASHVITSTYEVTEHGLHIARCSVITRQAPTGRSRRT